MKQVVIFCLFLLCCTSPNKDNETDRSTAETQKTAQTVAFDAKNAYSLTPLRDPLLPASLQKGNYELRYIECRPDDHLQLKIEERNGQIYLTDTGRSLQSANYTLNGWTDPENAGKLENEVIRPYTLYHLSKYSIARPTIREVWMAMHANPKPEFKRSELFFYVVPKSEKWNPAGESNNPIRRPAAFAKIPKFKLKNRVYGFEYDFVEESSARLDELDITFNRKPGQKHLKLYTGVLSQYLHSLPVRKGFESLTDKEAIDFANTLPIEKILAFDIEPGAGDEWMINYQHPNFEHNMTLVINRLKQRGAMAYNWMEVPAQSVKNLTLDRVTLSPHAGFGENNNDVLKYRQAYRRLKELKKRANPYSVISTGYGYTGYDYNLTEKDGNGQNSSPQLTYLKSLDASELWKKAFPDKEQVYFSWPFMEFNVVTFPANYIVEIPEFQTIARRTDNKPLYAPSQWEDNLTLGLLKAKYLFYWSPGAVSWNPAHTANWNDKTSKGFTMWTFEKGSASAPSPDRTYIGKESMAINATIKAAYQFSRIQDAADGRQYAPAFMYERAAKDGSTHGSKLVSEIQDGSWYVSSLIEQQPFCIVAENNGQTVLFFQDVWARPGQFTKFQVTVAGKSYQVTTEGNRLFIAKLP